MKRRHFLSLLAGVAAVRVAFAQKADDPIKITRLELSKEEWKKRLTPEQYAVLREEATERPSQTTTGVRPRAAPIIAKSCRRLSIVEG